MYYVGVCLSMHSPGAGPHSPRTHPRISEYWRTKVWPVQSNYLHFGISWCPTANDSTQHRPLCPARVPLADLLTHPVSSLYPHMSTITLSSPNQPLLPKRGVLQYMQGQEAVDLGSGCSPLTQGLLSVPSTSPHMMAACAQPGFLQGVTVYLGCDGKLEIKVQWKYHMV